MAVRALPGLTISYRRQPRWLTAQQVNIKHCFQLRSDAFPIRDNEDCSTQNHLNSSKHNLLKQPMYCHSIPENRDFLVYKNYPLQLTVEALYMQIENDIVKARELRARFAGK